MTDTTGGLIFHIATRTDWQEALRTGTYTTSTIGRTLEEEGFIHASRRDQVAGVFDRYYRDSRDLVLLTIVPERLEAEVREEPVGDDTYPHICGPITPRAVTDVRPLDRRGRPQTLGRVFLWEMARRMVIAVAVMALIVGVVTGIQHLAK